jgi:hypothetical protein
MQKPKRSDDHLFRRLFGKGPVDVPEDPMTLIARLLVDQIEETLPAVKPRARHSRRRRSK